MAKRTVFKEFRIENAEKEIRWFRLRLRRGGLLENTITSYAWTLGEYLRRYDGVVSADNLIHYRMAKIETNAPATVNNRMHGLNRYCEEKDLNFHLKDVRIQTSQYLENVISMADYKYLKKSLKRDENWYDYFLIWALGCTGARVSEIVQMKIEHVYDGTFSIYGKGMKQRIIFMSKSFQKECISWLEQTGREDGFLFITDTGAPLDKTKVEYRIKRLAKKYRINPDVMHPHSFRHMFGKTFYEKSKNLVMLKDILGHASISTTSIYCKPSLTELVESYNNIVKW